jgi:hypothetical protein
LDRDIQNFQRLRKAVDGPLALILIALAVEKLESEKVSLHPEEEE